MGHPPPASRGQNPKLTGRLMPAHNAIELWQLRAKALARKKGQWQWAILCENLDGIAEVLGRIELLILRIAFAVQVLLTIYRSH